MTGLGASWVSPVCLWTWAGMWPFSLRISNLNLNRKTIMATSSTCGGRRSVVARREKQSYLVVRGVAVRRRSDVPASSSSNQNCADARGRVPLFIACRCLSLPGVAMQCLGQVVPDTGQLIMRPYRGRRPLRRGHSGRRPEVCIARRAETSGNVTNSITALVGLDKQACSLQSAARCTRMVLHGGAYHVCAVVHVWGDSGSGQQHTKVARVARRSPTASSRSLSAQETAKSSDTPPDPGQTCRSTDRLNTWRSTQESAGRHGRSNMRQQPTLAVKCVTRFPPRPK